jgi:hypothetical protein
VVARTPATQRTLADTSLQLRDAYAAALRATALGAAGSRNALERRVVTTRGAGNAASSLRAAVTAAEAATATEAAEAAVAAAASAPAVAAAGAMRALRVAAVDPGVCVPATIYDPTRGFVEFAPRISRNVLRMLLAADKLVGVAAEAGSAAAAEAASSEARDTALRSRAQALRVRARILRRCTGMIDNMHRQLGAYLSRTYDVVLWGHMSVAGMMRRRNRRLRTKTVRAAPPAARRCSHALSLTDRRRAHRCVKWQRFAIRNGVIG